MFLRWLFGYSPSTDSKSALLSSNQKPLTGKWKLVDGVWQKSSPQAKIVESIIPILTNTMIPEPDGIENVETKKDALGILRDEFEKQIKKFNDAINEWKNIKINIIGGEVQEPQEVTPFDKTVMIRVIFAKIFEEIISLIECPEENLRHLFAKTFPHIKKLCEHIEEDCEKLKRISTNQEKDKIKVDICNTAMDILNELIVLLNDIQGELTYCITSEKVTEVLAKQMIRMLIQMITTIPLPEFQFSLSEKYRHYLYDEIKEEKIVLEQFISTTEGELLKGKNTIEKTEVVMEARERRDQLNEFSQSTLFHTNSNNNVRSSSPELIGHALSSSNPETLPYPSFTS